jgi:hypothetical protein
VEEVEEDKEEEKRRVSSLSFHDFSSNKLMNKGK